MPHCHVRRFAVWDQHKKAYDKALSRTLDTVLEQWYHARQAHHLEDSKMRFAITWLPRMLGVCFAAFCYLFVLEGFSPKFNWRDSLFHFLQGSVMLAILLVGWKWSILGALLYAAIGVWVLVDWRHTPFTIGLGSLLIGTGALLVASRYI